MLKFSYYIDDIMDKAWFDSSNVVYGECDESDTQYKTVRIVFKNGSTYQYEDVLVADWVSFKNAESQGKALNEHFKKAGYKYSRIEDSDLEKIEKEFLDISGFDFILTEKDGKLVLKNQCGKEIYAMKYPGVDVTNDIKGLLEALYYKINIIEEKQVENGK